MYSSHLGRVTHICVGNLAIIGPDNVLSPGRRQTIIWTNAGLLLIGPLGTNSSSSSSSNFIPNRKQSTAYMSKDTSVNQYTLMFCWCSPEEPKAYLAGNQNKI